MKDDKQAESLQNYKDFIDGLVDIRLSVLSNWVLTKGWPKTEENSKINEFINGLSQDQKQILAHIIQQSRDGGIHDVLVFLTDEININGLKLIKNETEMAKEPFDSEMYYDWDCRREGDPWPDSEKS
ncbi:hypothetical protein Back11_17660 [Paenibacillus baekrokdamisoli]|uniref:Uncharacterized protein n=1 Tax=Paenibacillus baekrokdamisoli TaxID=1712516 RepID=A0A3G9J3P4_9BACL|nr:DUF6547 family protein [Paenibacillus baekrokdamisoli]MBB3073488.1 hypothetical protein [Paenibacillus baekrokdamisoli]BBH20421.1 hypothetical protein Back11_17660 [Paenibacillus baekrokdamisoli]